MSVKGRLSRRPDAQLCLSVGIAAALVAVMSDTLLLYSPAGGYLNLDYAFFSARRPFDLQLGHFLGVIALPVVGVGFFGWYQIFAVRFPNESRWGLGLSLAALAFGTAYHAQLAGFGMLVLHRSAMSAQAYETQLAAFRLTTEPLGLLFGSGFALLSMGLFGLCFRSEPRPIALLIFNPGLVYFALAALYWLFPPVGNWTIVVAFNLSIAVFLLAVRLTIASSSDLPTST